jgi:ribonucleoside-diphosphate reductase beta chain
MSEYRKILDGDGAGVNQLIGATRKQPIEWYNQGMDNHWRPKDVNMTDDAAEWRNGKITDDEKLIVKRALGLFSAGESEVNNNIFLSEYRYVTDGAARQYMVRKAQEEAIHNETVMVCCEYFNLSEKEVAEAYLNVPSIKRKSDFLLKNTHDVLVDKNFDITIVAGKQQFLKNIITYYIICEGMFFWSNFVMLLSIYRRGLLKGVGKQIKYTLRDESIHVQFGVWLINEIKKDYPEIWTKEFQKEVIDLINEAIEIEIEYAKDTLPRPMMGFNSSMFVDFVKFVGNQRFIEIGIDFKFPNIKNPFPWVAEVMEAKSMTAFFENKEIDYKHSSALEDDF